VHVVTGGGMRCTETSPIVLETEVGKAVLLTAFGAATC